jgi:hypothetical protein
MDGWLNGNEGVTISLGWFVPLEIKARVKLLFSTDKIPEVTYMRCDVTYASLRTCDTINYIYID